MPLDFLEQYPSLGGNTIFEKLDFEPWYYVAVDSRVMNEFGEVVLERFGEIPKFVPRPNLDKWQGANFYRFYHRPGPLWPYDDRKMWPSNLLSEKGITFACVPHVMMQIAFYMGFSKMLIVGMDHSKHHREHFWGCDEKAPNRDTEILWKGWEKGHKQLFDGFMGAGVEMINVTPNSRAQAIPHGDWRAYYG